MDRNPSPDIPAREKMLRDSVARHADAAYCPLSATWRIGLVDSDFQNRRFTFSFYADESMRNPLGFLQGSVSAGMIDSAMGVVACCYSRDLQPAITAELNVSYLRPVCLPAALNVTVAVLRAGGHLIHLWADLFSPEDPDRLLVCAKGTFYGK